MGFFKPIIITGGGSAIELADNLTTTTKGKALDASQAPIIVAKIPDVSGLAKKSDIPTMPDLSGYAIKTNLYSRYANANDYTAYLSILSSVGSETKVIDLLPSTDSFILNTNSYAIAAGSRCTLTIEGFSPYNGLAIFKPTYSYKFSIIPYPLLLTANSNFTYKCRFENMYDMSKTMTNIGSLQLVYLK